VFQIVSRILGSSEAEDAAQEVFLQAFQFWQKQRVDNWPGLLRRIATRNAIDRLRRRTLSKPLSFDPVDEINSPCEQLSTAELATRLRLEVARLPARQAEIFALRYLEGLSNNEIADLLGTSPSSVSTALAKARDSLATRLADLKYGDKT
jgi:RNA polymerase sigma-70 factor (ECF subfamily)